MKKSIIAAGAASVALAAMPIVGAFAATTTGVKDEINAVVNPGCTITRSGKTAETDFLDTAQLEVIAGGAEDTKSTTLVNVSCSDPGWSVRIAPTVANEINLTSGGNSITPGTSGTASYWAYKVDTKIGNGNTATGTYYALTAQGADVITAESTTTAAAKTGEFTPGYKVFAATSQASGTYTGGVTYTIASLADPQP